MYSKIALSIAGSDSGGGAGIQADLRTFMSLRVHGCSVITCVTAQNSQEVIDVEAIKIKTITSQLDSLFSDFEIGALKTGMLLNEKIILNTAAKLNDFSISKIIDPVIFSRTGAKLLEDNAINAYKKFLFPQAEVITPNIFEANLLTNKEIKNKIDIEEAGELLLRYGSNAVLIKGGRISNFQGCDYYLDKKGNSIWFKNNSINTNNTHGSGCTLSAAICSYRALGLDLIEAIKRSKNFIEKCLEKSYKIGKGPGPLGHFQ